MSLNARVLDFDEAIEMIETCDESTVEDYGCATKYVTPQGIVFMTIFGFYVLIERAVTIG